MSPAGEPDPGRRDAPSIGQSSGAASPSCDTRRMSAGDPASRRVRRLHVVVLAALTIATFVVVWRGTPGVWAADALFHVERLLGKHADSTHPRADRTLFLSLIRACMQIGDDPVRSAGIAGAVAAALVPAGIWFALRERVDAAVALLPGAAFALTPLVLREARHPGADILTAGSCALTLPFLPAAVRTGSRAALWAGAAGAVSGLGVVLKESSAFWAAGAAIALLAAPQPGRVRRTAVFAGVAVAIVGVATLLSPARGLAVATHFDGREGASIAWDAPGFLHRVTVALPQMILTDDHSFGPLFVAAAPLLARLPFRAARGDLFAACAVASLLAFAWMPVAPGSWVVLYVSPRFLLCLLPALLAATLAALDEAPASKAEAAVSVVALLLPLAAGADAAGRLILTLAAVAAAGPAIGVLLPRWRHGLARPLAAGALVVAAGAAAAPLNLLTGAAVAAGLAAAIASAAGTRVPRARPVSPALAVLAVGAALAGAFSVAAPTPMWDLWRHVPAGATVHTGDGHLFRCLWVCARLDGDATSRVRLVGDREPADPAPGDVIVRSHYGTRVETRAGLGEARPVCGYELVPVVERR